MRRMTMVVSGLALALALAAAPAVSHAATITFGGNITTVPAALSSFFTVGDPISGSYTFTYPQANCGNATECSYTVITALSVTFGSYTATYPGSGTPNSIRVRNNFGGSQDLYEAKAKVGGSALGSYSPQNFTLTMVQPSGTALSNTDLPGALPDPSLFAIKELLLTFCDTSGGCGSAKADVHGSLTAIPEPTSMFLLGTGLAGLATRMRRRR